MALYKFRIIIIIITKILRFVIIIYSVNILIILLSTSKLRRNAS